jgi:septum formation protein
MNKTPLILASKSGARIAMLRGVGLEFECVPADIDEREVEERMQHARSDEIASELARVKAAAVSQKHPNALVIGSDQILDFGGTRLHKSETRDDAVEKLDAMAGKTHHLISAVSLVQGGQELWSACDRAALKMHDLDRAALADYADRAGDAVMDCVGGYALEAHGAWLFEKIEGDYFTILGMPLLPLLGELRANHGGMS